VQEQANFWECEGFLPEFSQTCPKLPPKKKETKALYGMVGAIIAHISRGLLRFSGILGRLSEILPGFSPNQNF